MPFQPNAFMTAILWRYQVLNASGSVVSEWYVNLANVQWMQTTRTPAPVTGGQTPTVSFWFKGNTSVSNDPDLVLNGPQATQFLSDMDTLWGGTAPSSMYGSGTYNSGDYSGP